VFIDDQAASQSKLAEFVRTYPIKSKIVLAHIRMATQGDVSLANCQPFQREWLGQTWLFAHNGDLKNFHPQLTGAYLPVGSSDSEKAFCWLMQQLRERFAGRQRPPTWQELAQPLAEITEGIARHGNFNFMLSNGDALYAHCSSKLHALERAHPFATAKLVDCDMRVDLGALNREGDRMVLIATEPLTSDEPWSALVTGEFRVFVDGAAVWRHVSDSTQVFPIACRITSNIAPNISPGVSPATQVEGVAG
jgi:glutamine amidotransferase